MPQNKLRNRACHGQSFPTWIGYFLQIIWPFKGIQYSLNSLKLYDAKEKKAWERKESGISTSIIVNHSIFGSKFHKNSSNTSSLKRDMTSKPQVLLEQ
jgi:hypothetical protein